MCFHIGINISRTDHIKLKGKKKKLKDYQLALDQPLASGFEYPLWPVLKPLNGGEDFVPVMMHWEFIPSYIKTVEGLLHFRKGGLNAQTGRKDFPHNTLNAIGEKVLTKPTYKDAAKNRRCLVLASGFFEWRHFTPPWVDEQTGEMVDSFSILTTAANSLMAQVHNKKKRMPVILPEEEASEWIRAELSVERISALAKFQIESSKLNAITIAKDFRQSENPTEGWDYKELPGLV
jgi:putative SOS response-associated peptidase YedK